MLAREPDVLGIALDGVDLGFGAPWAKESEV
jgi:hypothetical protein